MLLRIEDEDKRSYYMEEACNNNWGSRQLERQINSQLYERLLLSDHRNQNQQTHISGFGPIADVRQLFRQYRNASRCKPDHRHILLCTDKNNTMVEKARQPPITPKFLPASINSNCK